MVNYTKQMISEKMCELLQHKTIDKITVKSLVEECGINRQTFYYHFCDIYDLLEWTLMDNIRRYEESHPVENENLQGRVSLLFKFFFKYKIVIMHAYDQSNRLQYEIFIKKNLYPVFENYVSKCPCAEKLKDDKKLFICNVYTLMASSFILQWIEEGMPDEYKIRLEDYFTIMDGSIERSVLQFTQ